MPKPSEYWSEELAHSSGKPDANLATDALQLGGIEAEDYATKKYVQDYHNNKEELLKEYIDSQDLAKLQAAKDYVDTMIRNQDFSMFAKVTDLQTLSEMLSARIEACKAECQQEIRTRINAVVQDVNSNFDDVNGAISQLNSRTSELFTSVSNGKDLVADAITDKGIHTSATDSFSTMATNIRNIQTEGGGEYDENFVNTADGNITANDVALGKIGYAKGNKIIGSHQDLDTSDATATAYDILEGKTAYSNGQKITGTRMETQYPTYGTDTTNATANANDIALGKTAFVGGEYVTGTATPVSNPDVEEIYALSVNQYALHYGNAGLVKFSDTEDTVVSREKITLSKDGRYCVSIVKLNDINSTEYCIESHPINENGIYIVASSGENDNVVYRKYRYTKGELGIENDENILDFFFGSSGFLGHSSECLLAIKTYKQITDENNNITYKRYLHFYTYHLVDEGRIGRSYNEERAVQNCKVEYTDIEDLEYNDINSDKLQNIIFLNNNPNCFIALREGDELGTNPKILGRIIKVTPILNNNQVSLSIDFGTEENIWSNRGGSYMHSSVSKLFITADDKYITSGAGRSTQYGIIIGLNNEFGNIGFARDNFVSSGYYSSGTYLLVQNTNQSIYIETSQIKVYSKDSSGNWIYTKTINYTLGSGIRTLGTAVITPDCSRVVFLVAQSNDILRYYNTLSFLVINVNDILNANDGDTILPLQSSSLGISGNGSTSDYTKINMFLNTNGNKIFVICDSNQGATINAEICILTVDTDNTNLIGVRYMNKFFRNTQTGLLSATPSDVANGKTFIGYDGTVQTGTLT